MSRKLIMEAIAVHLRGEELSDGTIVNTIVVEFPLALPDVP